MEKVSCAMGCRRRQGRFRMRIFAVPAALRSRMNWWQETESCNCARQYPRMAGARLRRRHEDSSTAPSPSTESLSERIESTAVLMGASRVFMRNRMALVRRADNVQIEPPAVSVKATRRISAFPHNGPTRRFVRNALRLKLHGAPAALEDRAGCFYSTFSAIVAQNSIVPDTH